MLVANTIEQAGDTFPIHRAFCPFEPLDLKTEKKVKL